MAQFLKEIAPTDLSDKEILSKIIVAIQNDTAPFATSQLYSPAVGERYIDTEKRSSQYKIIVSTSLFALCDALVAQLSKLDKVYNYKLVHNDVTHIKYAVGDYFKPHSDYLSLRSNIIEEYTLLLCLDSNAQGGRTIFHINEFFKHASEYSRKAEHMILFRKDLIHEGEILQSGFKEIATLNIWATQKDTPALVVTFENDVRIYSMPLAKILSLGETYFSSYYSFMNTDKNVNRILEHRANCTYDEFQPVYRVLTGQYISIREYTDLFDYYKIDPRCILIANEIERGVPAKTTYTFDDSIIMLPNGDYDSVLKIIKDSDLPYVPFRIVIVEGTLEPGGTAYERPLVKLDAIPVWISAGELNNVYYSANIISYCTPAIPLIDDVPLWCETKRNYADTVKNYGFQSCMKNITTEEITGLLFTVAFNPPPPLLYAGDIVASRTTPYWSLDIDGKMYLNLQQAESLVAHIKSSPFINSVKEAVNKSQIELSQHVQVVREDFCNESLYGKCSVLYLTGFMRTCASH